MDDMLDRLAFARGSRSGCAADQDPAGRAIGLTFAAGASLGLWVGLAHAARWAAQTIF